MDLSAYFNLLIYVLMGVSFVALILIFLYAFFGKEEEQTNLKT